MNKLALTFLALPILLAGIGAADSKNSRINQALRVQKVCPHEHRLVQRLFEEDS
jgi:hypothetical protein